MIRVGLTGGYATGKTFVAGEFARLGCHVIYADQLGHEVLEPGGQAYEKTVKLFGPEILAEDGRIDRKKLAAIVFESAERLEELTAIVHPAVFKREEEITARLRERDPHAVVIYEAAILIETGRNSNYDRVIVTSADEETQIARGIKRDRATREQVLARIANQLPLAEKRKFADFVIDTSGTKEETIRHVHQVYDQLKAIA
jgi:dephospho-CoA kinase